jgi:peptidoglycan-associated lipoprotein
MHALKLIPAVLACALLAACSPASKMPDGGAGAGQSGAGTGGATTGGIGDGDMGAGSAMGSSALGGPSASQENRIVYFDFDRFDVKADYEAVLQAHGRYLTANPAARVRLEGHGDERGSREYNIGLGEKRAQAVKQVLLLQGAKADQLATVSYGEERPAVVGSDEEAWSLNRRVEIVYGQ